MALLLAETFGNLPDARGQLLEKGISALWSAFLLALGVAIGRGKENKED
jgi:hypothetical protein